MTNPYLKNAIDNLRAGSADLEAANEAAEWCYSKSIDQIRIEIHKMHRQYKNRGERGAAIRADALLDCLNAKARANMPVETERGDV